MSDSLNHSFEPNNIFETQPPSTTSSSGYQSAQGENDFLFCPTYEGSWMYCAHDTPRCEKSMKAFDTKNRLPPMCERPQLAQFFQRKRILHMINRDYEKADEYTQIKKRFQQACSEKNIKNNKNYYIIDMTRKIDAVNQDAEKTGANWDKKIKDFKIDCLYKLDDLKIKHLAEIQKFNDYWTSDEILIKYSSPSPTLQDLYHQENKLLEFHDFNQASIIRKQKLELEEQETEQAQQKLIDDAQAKRKILNKRQIYELQRLEQYQIDGVNKLMLLKERDESRFGKRLYKLTQDRDNPNARPPLPQSWRFSEMGTQVPMAVTTPRTRSKLVEFRKSTPTTKLEIKGITSRPGTSIQRVRITL